MEDLANLARTWRVNCECSVMCFTETWLNNQIPDCNTSSDEFRTIWARRNQSEWRHPLGDRPAHKTQKLSPRSMVNLTTPPSPNHSPNLRKLLSAQPGIIRLWTNCMQILKIHTVPQHSRYFEDRITIWCTSHPCTYQGFSSCLRPSGQWGCHTLAADTLLSPGCSKEYCESQLLGEKMRKIEVDAPLVYRIVDYLICRPQSVWLFDYVSECLECSVGTPRGDSAVPLPFHPVHLRLHIKLWDLSSAEVIK